MCGRWWLVVIEGVVAEGVRCVLAGFVVQVMGCNNVHGSMFGRGLQEEELVIVGSRLKAKILESLPEDGASQVVLEGIVLVVSVAPEEASPWFCALQSC